MNSVVDRSRDIGPFVPQPDDDILICRCEEVTKGEIRQAVHNGLWTIAEVRRFLRCGMGLCQGQTCGRLVKAVVARELGISQGELESATSRAPMRPVQLHVFANEVVDVVGEPAHDASEESGPDDSEEPAAEEPAHDASEESGPDEPAEANVASSAKPAKVVAAASHASVAVSSLAPKGAGRHE